MTIMEQFHDLKVFFLQEIFFYCDLGRVPLHSFFSTTLFTKTARRMRSCVM